MLNRVICGGQTGVDQAAFRAAKTCGLATGGWMPRGFLTEEGRRPEFAEVYGAKEHESPEYSTRTKANIEASDATLILLPPGPASGDRGTRLTRSICRDLEKPRPSFRIVAAEIEVAVEWIQGHEIRTLNVAGPRESSAPGIGEAAERWLAEVFRWVKAETAKR